MENSASQGLRQMERRAENREQTAGEISRNPSELLFNYAWWMKKQGLKESTIEPRIRLLKILVKRGVDLLDPERVKEAIARQDAWCEGRKANAVDVYTNFLRMLNLRWEPPRYRRERRLPFIPTEAELDQLIAGCGRKTATFLQLLKETGVRCGEAWRLRWTDVDLENNIVTITPEKGSEPRQFKVSGKLIAMLNALPREGVKIWRAKMKTIQRTFQQSRARIAEKTRNPRILRITFHTFRHWKATMEYHKTKDIIHVMKLLGHRNINNTLKYTQLIKTDDEYISKVARTVEEACALIEAGYEYVTEFREEGVKIFRKRR
ncbi:MAG: site-specific integrase [Candidatus Bathyarchaeia archaeon]